MKTIEQWEQSAPERNWDNLHMRNPHIDGLVGDERPSGLSTKGIPIHQKVGTVIPFSRTVDRDPNPRIPLSVPEDGYPVVGKGEKLFGWATVVVIVVLAVWVW